MALTTLIRSDHLAAPNRPGKTGNSAVPHGISLRNHSSVGVASNMWQKQALHRFLACVALW
jgi:hypothetical protein